MKLMTTIVMLGLAVANVVASPVIRGTSDVETSNAETEILEVNDKMAASKGPCPRGSQLQCQLFLQSLCSGQCIGRPRTQLPCLSKCLSSASVYCQKNC
ncbi:hypothetical protein BB8028_0001g17330 [Beauveria bassiana]|uniref:Uncharacterized protein n=1 Tax=Beauveria bassiana TaxID=176275 RepID=A0A2S7Y0H3_BEABA|nr:hypothetical protein BB8028_0001g17330 [Beauveria bassiana]